MCAWYWRCRGGFLGLSSTFLARVVFWCIPFSLWGWSTLGYFGLVCGISGYLGLLISYSAFMGTNKPTDCLCMAGLGIARLIVFLSPVLYLYPDLWWVCILGGLSGLSYWIGWTYLSNYDSGLYFPGWYVGDKEIIKPGAFATSGSEWGEIITGAFLGATLDLIHYII